MKMMCMQIIIKDIIKISNLMIINKIIKLMIIKITIMTIKNTKGTMMIKVIGLIQVSIKDIGIRITNGLILVGLRRIMTMETKIMEERIIISIQKIKELLNKINN